MCEVQRGSSDSEDSISNFMLCIFPPKSLIWQNYFPISLCSPFIILSINKPSFPDESLQFIIKLEDETGLFSLNKETNYYQQAISPL